MKLGDDDADLELLRASGLRVTNCVPNVPSILPNAVIEGPDDVEERIESMLRVAYGVSPATSPDCVLCLTGPAGGRDETEARRLVRRRPAPGRRRRPTTPASGSGWSRSTPRSATS